MKQRQSIICNQIYDHENFTIKRKYYRYISQKQQKKKFKEYSQKKKRHLFSSYEERKILNLVLTYGPKFNKIARILKKRPANLVKNHYYKVLRFKWDQILGKDYNHFNCGKIQEQNDPLIKLDDVKQLFQQINFDSCLKQKFTPVLDSMNLLDISKWNFK